MNNFILFTGDSFYPCGGALDVNESFVLLADALEKVENINPDWWHILCLTTGVIVYGSDVNDIGR